VDKHCPLAEKCPYYDAIRFGKQLHDFDWTNTNCPAAGKCTYFEDIKKRALANGDHSALPPKKGGCPYAGGCPHAQNNHKHKEGDISKCPYLSSGTKKCPYLKNESEEEKSSIKNCPHFQKSKIEREEL
ncbi:4218_t:CDS:2, partial [Acaulospora morrowiae]